MQKLLHSRGIKRDISSGWWESFLRRHPNVTLRTPASLSKVRAIATNPVVINQYFDILEDALEENDLLDKPCQIYNLDETGMPLDPKPLKVVSRRGEKNPSAVSSGKKQQITVVGCVNAGGNYLPPMIIWNTKSLSAGQTIGEVPGTLHGFSPKGWMDQELFKFWFLKHFLRYAPRTRPLFLLLDGHTSHFCPDTIRLAAKEKVIVFTFPPNTTHLTQPLDKGIFGPLKIYWRNECHNYIRENPHKVVNKYSFCTLFSKAWMKSMTPANIISAFRTTGVYPVNRAAVKMPIKSSVDTHLAEECVLAYIPLYSPATARTSHRINPMSSLPSPSSPLCSTPSPIPAPRLSSPLPSLSSTPFPKPVRRLSPLPPPSSSSCSTQSPTPVPMFTEEEQVIFNRRWENGYDITTDHRYNLWCELHQPPNTDSVLLSGFESDNEETGRHVCQPSSYRSSFGKFLMLPSPPTCMSTGFEQTHSDRVITSAESIKLLEEKERKKKEKLQQKEICLKKAEEKRIEKQQQLLAKSNMSKLYTERCYQ